MNYDEMIYGLADEMLEKIAADDDDYGYDDGYYYDDDYDGYDGITEEDLDYMSDDELESLAEAMYEDELEKTAGCGSKIGNAARTVGGYAEYGARTAARKLAGKKSRQYLDAAAVSGLDAATAKKLRNKGLRRGALVGGAKTLGAAGVAGGTAYGVRRFKNKGQEKAAQMYEEAQLYKQAAEETWEEAQMIQDAASVVFDYLEY